MSLIEALSRLSELIDPALALKECLRYGVKEISFERHPFGIPGSYENGTIFIDPKMDRARVVRTIGRRHGLEIAEGEAPLWIFYHELGHHVLGSD